eukprot:11349709-Karenia_brevis.AAC.1
MFRQDVKDGHMRWMSDQDATKEFGSFTTTTIGALEKSDSTLRIFHDATHGVAVNPLIVPRDQVAYPTVAEKVLIVTRAAQCKTSLMGLKADVSKAHRRCRIHKADQ